MFRFLVLLVPIFTISCTSLTPAGIASKALGLGSDGGVEVSANVGKEIKDEDSIAKVTGEATEIKADKISGGINKTTIQEVPLEFMLLMVLGWLLPSPGSIWRGFVDILPWRKKS